MKHVVMVAELDAAMRQADGHQLDMIQRYGKPYAARAARRELDRRDRERRFHDAMVERAVRG